MGNRLRGRRSTRVAILTAIKRCLQILEGERGRVRAFEVRDEVSCRVKTASLIGLQSLVPGPLYSTSGTALNSFMAQ